MGFIDYRAVGVARRAGLFARVTDGVEFSIRIIESGVLCPYRVLRVSKDNKA